MAATLMLPRFGFIFTLGLFQVFSIREKSHVAIIGVIRHCLHSYTENTPRIPKRVYTLINPHERHSILGTIPREDVHYRSKYTEDVYFDVVCDS